MFWLRNSQNLLSSERGLVTHTCNSITWEVGAINLSSVVRGGGRWFSWSGSLNTHGAFYLYLCEHGSWHSCAAVSSVTTPFLPRPFSFWDPSAPQDCGTLDCPLPIAVTIHGIYLNSYRWLSLRVHLFFLGSRDIVHICLRIYIKEQNKLKSKIS